MQAPWNAAPRRGRIPARSIAAAAALLLLALGSCSDRGPTGPGAAAERTLTVIVTGPGRATSQPAGIDCTAAGGAGCTVRLPNGTQVTLTGLADGDHAFGGWSNACTGTGACTLALTADLAVGAAFGINRSTAIERVREELVDALAADRFILALMTQQPLAPGTPVHQDGAEDGEPPIIVAAARSYFVFVDPIPLAMYGHSVRFALVDFETGAVTVARATGTPSVGGTGLYDSLEERLESGDRFEPATEDEPLKPIDPDIVGTDAVHAQPPVALATFRAAASSVVQPADRLAPALDHTGVCRKVAVTVASGKERGIKNTPKLMANMLAKYGFEVHEFDSAVHTLNDVRAGIAAAAAGLGPCDKFFFYIHSHTLLQDDDNDDKPDGGRATFIDYGAGEKNRQRWSLRTGTAGSLPSILATITAGTVNVMMETCWAESLILHMQNPQSGAFEPKPGVTIHVFASSSWSKVSWFNNHAPRNLRELLGVLDLRAGLYSMAVMRKLEEMELDTDGNGEISVEEFEAAFRRAHDEVAAAMPKQDPRYASMSTPPGYTGLFVTKTGTGTGTVVSHPGGIDCGETCFGLFLTNDRVILLGIAHPRSLFREWTGDCTGTQPNAPAIVMDRGKVCQARFDLIPGFRLSVGVTGSGNVKSEPAGIDCGDGGEQCAADFDAGSTVRLKQSGGLFDGWSGDGTDAEDGAREVVMDADREVVATFVEGRTLAVTVTGTGEENLGDGVVFSTPFGITCAKPPAAGDVCTADFAEGSTVRLFADKAPGSVFVEWSGGCTPSPLDGTLTDVVMDEDVACTARFARVVEVSYELMPASGVNATFDAAVHPIPVLAGSYTLTNTGDASIGFAATMNGVHLDVAPKNGILGPGQSEVLEVSSTARVSTQGQLEVFIGLVGSPEHASETRDVAVTWVAASNVDLVPGASHQLGGRAEGISVPRPAQTGSGNTATAVDQDGNRTDLRAVPGGDAYSGRVAFGTAAAGAAGPGLEVVQTIADFCPGATGVFFHRPANNSGPAPMFTALSPGLQRGCRSVLGSSATTTINFQRPITSGVMAGSHLVFSNFQGSAHIRHIDEDLLGRHDRPLVPEQRTCPWSSAAHSNTVLIVAREGAAGTSNEDCNQTRGLYKLEIPAFNTSAITGSLLIGTMPREVVISPDGSTAYLADYAEKLVHVIDVGNMSVTGTIPAPGGPTGLALTADGALLLATYWDTNEVAVLEVASGQDLMKTGSGGEQPVSVRLSSDEEIVWVLNYGKDNGATAVVRVFRLVRP